MHVFPGNPDSGQQCCGFILEYMRCELLAHAITSFLHLYLQDKISDFSYGLCSHQFVWSSWSLYFVLKTAWLLLSKIWYSKLQISLA